MDIYNKIEKSLLGLNSTDTKFAKELQEVKKYYEFYEGRPETIEDDTEDERGQLWKVKTDDYKPTREIRNITKKLMKKQKRFHRYLIYISQMLYLCLDFLPLPYHHPIIFSI